MSSSKTNVGLGPGLVYPIVIFLPSDELCENSIICGEITVNDILRTKNYFVHRYQEHVRTLPANTIGAIGNILQHANEKKSDWIRLKIHNSKPIIDEVISDNKNISSDECQVILYDKLRFQRSQLLLPSELDCQNKNSTDWKGSDHFKCLVNFLQGSHPDAKTNTHQPLITLFLLRFIIFLKMFESFLNKVLFILKFSTLALHMTSILQTAIWCVETVLKNKGSVTVKSGNHIFALITDWIAGILVIYWFINLMKLNGDILELLTSQSEVR